MFSSTKYPVLLALLFTLILATLTHAAPVAVGVSRSEPPDLNKTVVTDKPAVTDDRSLAERLVDIAKKEKELKETDWVNIAIDEKVAAYRPIFEEIDAAEGLVTEDTSSEAQQMREWRSWEDKMIQQLKGEQGGQGDQVETRRRGYK